MAKPPGNSSSTVVTVLRSVEEVEAIRPLWERLHQGDLPSDIDYFLTVARHHPAVVRPHVVIVTPPAGDPTLVAGHLSRLRVGHRLGSRVPYRPLVRAINIHHGVVGPPARAALVTGLGALADELGETVDAILLRNLEPESPLYRTALSIFPPRMLQRWVPSKARWAADIGASLEETLRTRSGTTRENVRRTRRRITTDFGDRAVVRRFDDPADAEELFRDLDAVAVKTYQQRSRPIFRGDEFERRLAEVGLRKGWYRAYLLYVDGRPVAFWTGFVYAGVFGWRGVTGYDPEFRRYSLGGYVLTHVLDELSRDPDVHQFSLGPGDFPYKRSFGDRRWELADVRIFATNPRGLWVNAVGSAVQGLHTALERARRVRHVEERVDVLRERRRRKEQGRSA